jgi:hypothetical protein
MNNVSKIVEKRRVEDRLRQEFEQTLFSRIQRWLSVKPHHLISYNYFSRVSSECYLLYRDGHYYGCISLTQSVAEALVKQLHTVHIQTKYDNYEKTIKQLQVKKILVDLLPLLTDIWSKRNDYHHLNATIEDDIAKLQELAKAKIEKLNIIEKEVYSFTTNHGKLVAKYPQYWNREENTVNGYLRID